MVLKLFYVLFELKVIGLIEGLGVQGQSVELFFPALDLLLFFIKIKLHTLHLIQQPPPGHPLHSRVHLLLPLIIAPHLASALLLLNHIPRLIELLLMGFGDHFQLLFLLLDEFLELILEIHFNLEALVLDNILWAVAGGIELDRIRHLLPVLKHFKALICIIIRENLPLGRIHILHHLLLIHHELLLFLGHVLHHVFHLLALELLSFPGRHILKHDLLLVEKALLTGHVLKHLLKVLLFLRG